jgi:hypothetical protein
MEGPHQAIDGCRAQVVWKYKASDKPGSRAGSFGRMIPDLGETPINPAWFSGAMGKSLMFSQDSFQLVVQSLFSDKIHQPGTQLLNFYHNYIIDNFQS